jgi:hypothetical protein
MDLSVVVKFTENMETVTVNENNDISNKYNNNKAAKRVIYLN